MYEMFRPRIFREGDPKDGGASALGPQVGLVTTIIAPILALPVSYWLSTLPLFFIANHYCCVAIVMYVARFDLGRPLPLHFLRRASKAGGVDSATHTLAK